MTTYSRFEGDPRLVLDDNGSTIRVKGGQPVMDQGLENVPLIDLLTDTGWWGNALFPDTKQQIGSDFEKQTRAAVTLTTLNNIESAGSRALQHMVDEKLAKDVLVKVRNPSAGRLEVGVVIQPPGRDILALLATRHGSNWVAQKEYPANTRI